MTHVFSRRRLSTLALLAALWPVAAQAQQGPPAEEAPPQELAAPDEAPLEEAPGPDGEEEPPAELDPVEVVAPLRDFGTVGGSARRLTEEDLEALKQDDPHAVMNQISGVYVRQEDAFGLRPNIGLRGASSDRSKKLTLMEDGVLFGPAPYSAPAAYYFPVMARMVGVEVYKGPGAILFGPNTIGGALDLKTREIPLEPAAGGADVSYGLYNSARAHGWGGGSGDWWGALAEVIHLRSDGFKELDGGGDTGFEKTEAMLKLRLNTPLEGEVYHEVELKLGYSIERSNETYLGLSDADFAANPDRRYVASALDQINWDRLQGQLRYRLEVGNELTGVVTLYRHDFARVWRRFNGFLGGADPRAILLNPDQGANGALYDVLTGAEDSSGEREDTIHIVDNDRSYASQGVMVTAQHRHRGQGWSNSAELGLRLHSDYIDRLHTGRGYLVQSARLVSDGQAAVTDTQNRGSALAFAAHLIDQLSWSGLTVAPGVRVEVIQTLHEDQLTKQDFQNDQLAVLPGLGVYYALTDELGVLAGAHRGFSPIPPQPVSQGVDPQQQEPETSLNYEGGLRWSRDHGASHAELIGFFNDYDNLTGICSFSSGCAADQLDRQFNAGQVRVYGAEVSASHSPSLAGFEIPLKLAYTWTGSTFPRAFVSEDPLYGEVEEGDALPYVPQHQGSLLVGVLQRGLWGVNLSATWTSALLEQAGRFDAPDAQLTDAQFYLDAKGDVTLFGWANLYLKVDNALDNRPIAARRPFGARPARPFQLQAGLQATF